MSECECPQRGLFIGMRKDQLGARLLMMLNSIRLAEDYGTDFRINWFPRGAMAPKLDTPSDLFDEAFIARHFIENDAFEALDDVTRPIWSFLNDPGPEKLEAHLAGAVMSCWTRGSRLSNSPGRMRATCAGGSGDSSPRSGSTRWCATISPRSRRR